MCVISRYFPWGRWPNCMRVAGILNWLFACSKSIWECRDFRSSKPELILVQIWVVLILSHLVYALRERIAMAADCDPFEVSVPLLVGLLPQLGRPSKLSLEQLIQSGRQLGLLRASTRLVLDVPQVDLSCYQPVPPDLPWQRPGRA